MFYGNWDTPYKSIGSRLDPWYSTGIGSHIGLFGNTGGRAKAGQASPTGPNNTNPDSFDRRQNNSVQYWTPDFNGLAARVAYSANEEKIDTAAGELDPSLWSGTVTYLNGPLYIAFAYERHEDYGGVDLEDDGIIVGIGYTFGNTTVNLIAERLDYELASGSDADRDAYHVGVLHKIGVITLRASFSVADDLDGFDESGATMVTAGASYTFSSAPTFISCSAGSRTTITRPTISSAPPERSTPTTSPLQTRLGAIRVDSASVSGTPSNVDHARQVCLRSFER